MPKTIIELYTDTMRSNFAGALVQTRLNNSPKSQIFSLLGGGISSLQRLLYNDEDSIKKNGKPLLSNIEMVRLIEEARFVFNLVINEQLTLLKDNEQGSDASDRFAYVDEWYDNIQNDWRGFLKLHKELITSIVDMYNVSCGEKLSQKVPSRKLEQLQTSGFVKKRNKEAIAFDRISSVLDDMENFALGSGIFEDIRLHVAELREMIEEL